MSRSQIMTKKLGYFNNSVLNKGSVCHGPRTHHWIQTTEGQGCHKNDLPRKLLFQT